MKVCGQPGCPTLTHHAYCPEHTTTPWTRDPQAPPRSTLSGTRQANRTRHILERDNYTCHICGQDGANQADHITPTSEGGPDTEDNMAAIHAWPCHQNKTQAEAKRAQARQRRHQR